MTFRELQKHLKKCGWEVKNQKGSHVHMIHPFIPGKITIPKHGKTRIKPGTLNAILKHAGLAK